MRHLKGDVQALRPLGIIARQSSSLPSSFHQPPRTTRSKDGIQNSLLQCACTPNDQLRCQRDAKLPELGTTFVRRRSGPAATQAHGRISRRVRRPDNIPRGWNYFGGSLMLICWCFWMIVSLASSSARRWPGPDRTTTSCKTTRRPTSFFRTTSMCVFASDVLIITYHNEHEPKEGRGDHMLSQRSPTHPSCPYRIGLLPPFLRAFRHILCTQTELAPTFSCFSSGLNLLTRCGYPL